MLPDEFLDELLDWLADLPREVECQGRWPLSLAEGYTALPDDPLHDLLPLGTGTECAAAANTVTMDSSLGEVRFESTHSGM